VDARAQSNRRSLWSRQWRRRVCGLLAGFMMMSMHSVAANAAATDFATTVDDLERQWARISYQLPVDQQRPKFEALSQQAALVAKQFPDRAEALAWQAMILCSHAESIGGLNALNLVTRAHDLLLRAAAIDERAMGGTIDGYLGTLYYKVPGWPIGFGDERKAKTYFQKSLAIDPTGIDPNYLYGHYLLDHGNKQEARKYLLKALDAPKRPGHQEYDAGRRIDIQADLAKTN